MTLPTPSIPFGNLKQSQPSDHEEPAQQAGAQQQAETAAKVLSPAVARRQAELAHQRELDLALLRLVATAPATGQVAYSKTWVDGTWVTPEELCAGLPYEASFGEIECFRSWRWDGEVLRSPYQNTIWWPGVAMEADYPPSIGHTGIYGHKTEAHLFQEEHENANHGIGWDVVGRVEIWGDVVEHEHGYRAEFCRITSTDHFHTRLAVADVARIKEIYADADDVPYDP